MPRIEIHEEYCMACKLCEVHCLVAHSRSKHIIKAFREEKDSIMPRVQVEESGYVSFALQCRHCDDAPCVEACMTGAMHRDEETGAVVCDEDQCVGCWMCIMVCPAGAVHPGKQDSIASKCDLCLEEGFPACVANCPNEAIIYREDNGEDDE